MPSWAELETDAPALARAVRIRFEAHGLALMATLRRDGVPRLSPVEPLFWRDDLWLGMMPGSLKVADLERDPRLALHSATVDRRVADGDAKIAGRAEAVVDPATFEAYRSAFAAEAGEVPEGPFPLFRIDASEASVLTTGGDHLVIEVWRAERGTERIVRR